MTPPFRTPQQRKQDTLRRLEQDVDAWVATADPALRTPYLIPLSFLWDGATLLFYSQPMRYYGKLFFWIKLALMALAGVNALYFHMTTYRSVSKWDRDMILPFGAKLAGVMSLILWAGVVIFGRLTAYNWFTYEP